MNKYKVGDKIVVEIEKTALTDNGGGFYIVLDYMQSAISVDEKSEPLSTYTEPLERKNENKQKQIEKLVDKLHRQAAEITRLLEENKRLKAENKKMSAKIDAYELYGDQHEEEYNQAFNQGAEAAWELVRKIFDMETNDIEDIFITEDAWNLGTVLNNYTYQEAAAKVAEWEKVKEIKVGDILEDRDEGNKVIVTSLKGRVICLLWDDGRIGTTYVELAKGIFRNTGRHIDIDGFLKQIRGEGDEK